MQCILPSCNNDSNNIACQGITFHVFPTEPSHLALWLKALDKEGWKPKEDSAVCSKHFQSSDLYLSGNGRLKVRDGAVPVNEQKAPDDESDVTSCNVKVCRICFAMDCELHRMTSNQSLNTAYSILTGLSENSKTKLPPYLCAECANHVRNSVKFKTRSLQALKILNEIIKKHGDITLNSIKSIKRNQNLLSSNQTDYYNFEVEHLEEDMAKDLGERPNRRKYTINDSIKIEKDVNQENLNAEDINDDMECLPVEHDRTAVDRINAVKDFIYNEGNLMDGDKSESDMDYESDELEDQVGDIKAEESYDLIPPTPVYASNLGNLSDEDSNDRAQRIESVANSSDPLIDTSIHEIVSQKKIRTIPLISTLKNPATAYNKLNDIVSSIQHTYEPQPSGFRETQNLNDTKYLTSKIDNISSTLVTVIENQSILSKNQKTMALEFSKLNSTLEEFIKGFCPRVVQGENKTKINFKPIENAEDLEKMEMRLGDPSYEAELVKKFSVICGQQNGNGLNVAYKLVDLIFHRDFMKQCSWAGGSRGEGQKVCFKAYKRTIEFFFNLVKDSDSLFKLVECESFFKTVLRNSLRRSMIMNVRESSTRRRVKKMKIKGNKKENNDNIAIDHDTCDDLSNEKRHNQS